MSIGALILNINKIPRNMIQSTNPFNDPEVKKQILGSEGKLDQYSSAPDLQNIIDSAPMLPSSAKNIIMDASAISKDVKEQKVQEMNYALSQVITRYNKEYGCDIQIDFQNLSKTLVNISNPETREVLELYVSEVYKSIKPILLLHLLNRMVLCMDYVLSPERMLDTNSLSISDLFIIVEKLQSYILTLNDIIEGSTIKDSSQLLKKIADDKGDENFSSPESKQAVDDFLALFKKEQGL